MGLPVSPLETRFQMSMITRAFNLNPQEVEQKIQSSRLASATYQENRQHNERKKNQFFHRSDLVANFLSLNP